ncbi:MAG: hypothetical protein AAF740_06690 [Bacteroidota bacterium]
MEILKPLFDEYFSERYTTLNEEQFEELVLYSPPLMVVACDDVLDRDELFFVEYFSKFLARNFFDSGSQQAQQDELRDTFESEMKFLLDNMNYWEDKFLRGAKVLTHKDERLKGQIFDLLEMFAESSDGISEEEQRKIDWICIALDIDA